MTSALPRVHLITNDGAKGQVKALFEQMKKGISFNEQNYPKSFASIKKNNYRLKTFSKLPEKTLEQAEGRLWNFIYKKAKATAPLKEYKNHKFFAAGWEWAVFKQGKDNLIKVPAQVFAEVNESKYLENTKFAYKKVLEYFPEIFVAKTEFQRSNEINIIKQEFIKGDGSFLIGFQVKNKKLLTCLIDFLNSALKMLGQYEWLPDFDIKKTNNGFNLGNVIIEKNSFIPKIIDFTAYYDVYRLYEKRKNYEVKEKSKRIREFIEWLKQKSKL